MTSNTLAGVGDGGDHQEFYEWENFSSGGGVNEIEELSPARDTKGAIKQPLDIIREEGEPPSSLFSFDFRGSGGEDAVYVAVGKQSDETTSMDALIWTINNLVVPTSTFVFLIHVFPETKFIPSPLGKIPVNQVNPEQKENHMAQERGKRREYLHKFLNVCNTHQVKVDTILIESDTEAKAILDLIPILNIRKLVLGTNKSNARRMRSRRGNGVMDLIMQGAPECCEVKIICDGKEVSELAIDSASPASSPLHSVFSPKKSPQEHTDSVGCGCFGRVSE